MNPKQFWGKRILNKSNKPPSAKLSINNYIFSDTVVNQHFASIRILIPFNLSYSNIVNNTNHRSYSCTSGTF